MSRSKKKEPFFTDGHAGSTKESKRCANKKVRHTENVPNGGAYKKVFESYDIHDYTGRWTWEDAKRDWERNKYLQERYPSLREYFRYWIKCCQSK